MLVQGRGTSAWRAGLVGALSMLLAAGCGEPQVIILSDTGVATVDTGGATPDAGGEVADAEVEPPDASEEADAGEEMRPDAKARRDASSEPDASPQTPDAGDQPLLSITGLKIDEGNADTTTVTVEVALSKPAEGVVTVEYATEDGTASAAFGIGGTDYATATGTLTFEPGDTAHSISLLVNGDTTLEADETFEVVLSKAVGAALGAERATITVTNDDAAPTLAIDSVRHLEGNAGTTDATFTVTLSAPTSLPVKAHYSTKDDTATAGSDYTATTGDLTFAPGETSKTLTVPVVGDTTNEDDETFAVNLSAPENATVDQDSGTCTIANDDSGLPTLYITGPAPAAEGNSGSSTVRFTVTITGARTVPVTVAYASADGTATAVDLAGGDYRPVSGTLTFDPADTSKTVDVVVLGDLRNEDDETFHVGLSKAVGAQIAVAKATATIQNDDALPAVSIADVKVTEGQAGTSAASFAVTLSAASGKVVTVSYATSDGTAVAGNVPGGSDYNTASGTLNFAAGTTTQYVTVFVRGDLLNEADETFNVTLSKPANATLGSAKAVGTIANDDPLPTLSILSHRGLETNSGNTPFVFAVNLSAASGREVTVRYATADGTGAAPATLANQDYVAASGTITFAPGETTQAVTAQVVGDTVQELNETFLVNLSQPVNATVLDGAGSGIIMNDDGAVTFINVADVSVLEGGALTNTSLGFVVSLSQPVPKGQTVTVEYATSAPLKNPATPGTDYTAATGKLTFAEGEQSKTVNVRVAGDNVDEWDEGVLFELANPSPGSSIQNGQALGLIRNDDKSPVLTIAYAGPKTLQEDAVRSVPFRVNLSAPSGKQVSVSYATADGTAQSGGTSPSGGHDYGATSGILTFAPGEVTRDIDVAIYSDTTFEPNENFTITLSKAVNAGLLMPTAGATIMNDDQAPTLSIDSVTQKEGTPPAGGSITTPMTFTVSLSNPTAQTVTVFAKTRTGIGQGTATPGGDYQVVKGVTLTFLPGQSRTPVVVMVFGDALKEADETFFVDLSAPVNATIATGTGNGVIGNDD